MQTLLHKPAYFFYKGVRRFVSGTGLSGPARKLLGPIAGRLFLRLSAPSDRPVVVHGHSMVMASGGGYPPIDMAMGRYEQATTNLVLKLIRPRMVVLDIGAHVGYYTLLAARQVGPEGKVYAFEPEPKNHALLLKNIEQNGYENIVVTKSAVSDRMGDSTLYLSALDNGRHSVYQQDYPQKGTVSVDTLTIDAFLESEGWPTVDLVKIDVEGAEVAVLRGMESLLERCPDEVEILVELSPSWWTDRSRSPQDVLQPFIEAGFHVYEIANNLWPWRYLWSKEVRHPRRVRSPLTKPVKRLDLVLSRVDADRL